MKNLQKYGLIRVGSWVLSKHKSTKHLLHLHGINFQLKNTIGEKSNVVYAFVAQNKVLYCGETTAGLKSRFQGYRYGNPLETDTDNRIKIAITNLLENGGNIDIWYAQPIGYLTLPSNEVLEIPVSKPLEELLISILKPEFNVKNLQKKLTYRSNSLSMQKNVNHNNFVVL